MRPALEKNNAKKIIASILAIVFVTCAAITPAISAQAAVSLEEISEYSGAAYVEINHNVPEFTEEDLTTEAFETYSDLDALGRCGVAYANICQEIMPTEERGAIGQVKPTGWHTVKYPDVIEDLYLYNRCHLIGYQLAGENANEKNLITGTRYLNIEGMLPFENEVADYVEETGHHVLYRVTPIFDGDNLVCNGIQMEAQSVEDNTISFNVFCCNVQPGIAIDYATGDSCEDGSYYLSDDTENNSTADTDADSAAEAAAADEPTANMASGAEETTAADAANAETATYILNTNTGKFHIPGCSSVAKMSEKNKQEVQSTVEELEAQGYSACKNCIG